MKEIYLKPFVVAAKEESAKFFELEIKAVNLRREKTLEMNHEVIIALGMKGDLTGLILMGMTEEHATNFSSQGLLKKGFGQYYKWDELSMSLMTEYVNQVVGHMTKVYEKLHYNCIITEPGFIVPEKTRFKRDTLSFQLISRIGKIHVKLHIFEKNEKPAR